MSPLHDEPPLPERIGKYRILSRLGQGGMGTVFEAQQDNPRRTVALKVVHAGVLTDQMRRRFELEAQVLGHLHHPCIAQIYEAGMHEVAGAAQPFFAMERIQGVPLHEYLEQANPTTEERLELLARICDGIQHAHQRGVIHRDLKPANILIEADGSPKILDFGLARATDSDIQTATMHTDLGQIMGTIPYMSPEQAAGDPEALDFRTDIYSLGVVAYRVVSGLMPYDAHGAQVIENLRVVREEEAAPLSSVDKHLRGDVETIIGKALEKDPARRYASAAEFAADIRRYLSDEPITARPPSALYQLSKFTRRNRGLVIGGVAVLLALVAGLVGTSMGFVRASSEAETASRTAVFFKSMLRGVDPAVAQGRDTTLFKVLLDDTAERLDVELADQPRIEATLRDTMAAAYFSIGEFEDALVQGRRAFELFEREYGPRDPDTITAHRSLGAYLMRFGELDAAERILSENLERAIEAYGSEHRETYFTRCELAILALELEDGDRAAELFAQVLEFRRAELGGDHADTLIAQNGLGLAQLKQRRYEEGERNLREVLEQRRRVSDPTDPETIKAVGNLGGAFSTQERYAEAEALFREALADTRRVLGPDHPGTLVLVENLVQVLRNTNQYEEALELQEHVLSLQRRRLGPDDPRTLGSESMLATVYLLGQRFAEAEPLARHAYEGYVANYGEEHIESLNAMDELLRCLTALGRADEAEAFRARALELHRKVLGGEHPDTLLLMHNQGVNLVNQLEYEAAEALLVTTLEARRRVLGSEGPETLRTVFAMSILYQRRGRTAEATPLLTECVKGWALELGRTDSLAVEAATELGRNLESFDSLAAYEADLRVLREYDLRALGPEALDHARDRVLLGDALAELGRHPEAVEMLEPAFEMYGERQPPARAFSAYGAALAGLERFDEAQDMLLIAFEDEQRPGLRRATAQRLVRLYGAWGRPDEATAWRERAAN